MKTINRVNRYGAVAVLALVLVPLAGLTQPAWNVSSASGYPTQHVVLDLALSDTTGIAGANLTVKVDNTAVVNFYKFDGTNCAEKAGPAAGWQKDENLVSASELRVVMYSNPPAGLAAGTNVVLARVHLMVAAGASSGATAQVSLDTGFDTTVTPKVGLTRLSDATGVSITPTATAGTITVLAAPFTPFDQNFAGGQLDWTAVQVFPTLDLSGNPPCKTIIAGTGIGLKVTDNAPAYVFGYYTSPEGRIGAVAPDNIMLRVNWTASSNQTDPASCPAFRFRLLSSDFSLADTIEIQSPNTITSPGRVPPTTTPKTYGQYLVEPIGVKNAVGPDGYIMNFDIESIDQAVSGPLDSTIVLHNASVNWGVLDTSSPTPVAAFNFDFTSAGTGLLGWTTLDKTAIPILTTLASGSFPNTAVAEANNGIILRSENAPINEAGKFSLAMGVSPVFTLTGGDTVLYRLRATIATITTDPTKTPEFRLRLFTTDFQYVQYFEVDSKKFDAAMVPSAAGTDYFMYFVLPSELNGAQFQIAIDGANVQPEDDPNGGIKLLKASLDQLPVPAFN